MPIEYNGDPARALYYGAAAGAQIVETFQTTRKLFLDREMQAQATKVGQEIAAKAAELEGPQQAMAERIEALKLRQASGEDVSDEDVAKLVAEAQLISGTAVMKKMDLYLGAMSQYAGNKFLQQALAPVAEATLAAFETMNSASHDLQVTYRSFGVEDRSDARVDARATRDDNRLEREFELRGKESDAARTHSAALAEAERDAKREQEDRENIQQARRDAVDEISATRPLPQTPEEQRAWDAAVNERTNELLRAQGYDVQVPQQRQPGQPEGGGADGEGPAAAEPDTRHPVTRAFDGAMEFIERGLIEEDLYKDPSMNMEGLPNYSENGDPMQAAREGIAAGVDTAVPIWAASDEEQDRRKAWLKQKINKGKK